MIFLHLANPNASCTLSCPHVIILAGNDKFLGVCAFGQCLQDTLILTTVNQPQSVCGVVGKLKEIPTSNLDKAATTKVRVCSDTTLAALFLSANFEAVPSAKPRF
ncbi:uncharacterized protein LOC132046141 [Lycium ferocissimum]|uniref:uncharacterized protein LOC132046141 n=1 Tax=Lycium ferocissimum TaxID=112874 RepID=UPI0028152991|nr:uncharacterized protein LOC132046141 [Lycium ferocissimum]